MKAIWMMIKKRIRWSIKRMSNEKKRMVCYSAIALIVGITSGHLIGKNFAMKKVDQLVLDATVQVKQEDQKVLNEVQKELEELKKQEDITEESELPWNLVLLNEKREMEEGYEPKLAKLQGDYYVDARIVEAAKDMLADAKKDGMKMVICSAYRSVERQEQIFNESMQERLNLGMSYWDAYVDTSRSVAHPEKSEHALGLALDLISNQYAELDKKQETTKEAKWLKENCYKYGFILRYPPEKMDITGIIYEPWHYRYVGVECATEIMEAGITLEEYLQDKYGIE